MTKVIYLSSEETSEKFQSLTLIHCIISVSDRKRSIICYLFLVLDTNIRVDINLIVLVPN